MKKLKYFLIACLFFLFAGLISINFYPQQVHAENRYTIKMANESSSELDNIELRVVGEYSGDDGHYVFYQETEYTIVVWDKTTNDYARATDYIFCWKVNDATDPNAKGNTFTYKPSKNKNGDLAIHCICEKTDHSISKDIQLDVTIQKTPSTVSEAISTILNNKTVIIFVVGIAGTIMWRCGYKIYDFGVKSKSNFATVAQQKEFEKNIRDELRRNKIETQDELLKTLLREIANETRPIKNIQSMAENMKTNKEIMDVQINNINEKYDEIRKLSDEVRTLEAKVNRIQYGDVNVDNRRSGK